MEKYLYLFIDYVASVGLSVGMKVLYSAIILIVGLKLIGFFVKFITNSKGFQKIDSTVQSFIKSFTSIGLKVLLLIIVASTLGVELTSVMALLASAGLAVGLALQGALSNIAGGLIILIFKPLGSGLHRDAVSFRNGKRNNSLLYYTGNSGQ